jgi:hypothetical protein
VNIVQILIAFGLFGILSLGMTEVAKLANDVVSGMQTRLGNSLLAQTLLEEFKNPSACTSSLMTKKLDLNPSQEMAIAFNIPGVGELKDGSTVRNFDVQIKSLRITGVRQTGPANNGTANLLYQGIINMAARPLKSNLIGGSLRERSITAVVFEVDANKNIVSCYGGSDLQTLCLSMGGTYLSQTNKCALLFPCPQDSVLVGNNTDGSPICKTIDQLTAALLARLSSNESRIAALEARPSSPASLPPPPSPTPECFCQSPQGRRVSCGQTETRPAWCGAYGSGDEVFLCTTAGWISINKNCVN